MHSSPDFTPVAYRPWMSVIIGLVLAAIISFGIYTIAGYSYVGMHDIDPPEEFGWIFLGGTIVLTFLFVWLLRLPLYAKDKKFVAEYAERRTAYIKSNSPRIKKVQDMLEKFGKLSDEIVGWDFLPEYNNFSSLKYVIDTYNSRRADSFKEALNLCIQETKTQEHHARLEEEAEKQTEYAAQAAEYAYRQATAAEEAASAARATAKAAGKTADAAKDAARDISHIRSRLE
jgi:hypothetical protein